MDWENITRELNRRFAEPLAEFYKRRIIFWYDEDREFEDKVAEMELANAKLLILTGTKQLCRQKVAGRRRHRKQLSGLLPAAFSEGSEQLAAEISEAVRTMIRATNAGLDKIAEKI